MSQRILVFPGGMPRAIAFAQQATADGQRILGASSLVHDPAREHYREWATLPFVTDDAFHDALARLIAAEGISAIFTPNPVVWQHLQRTLQERHPGVRLVNESPVDREMAPYRAGQAFARSVLEAPLQIASPGSRQPGLDARELTALFRHADALPGMCDHEKIRALCEVFRQVPQGDVIEIGSWWGKSAFILNLLARKAGTGPVLCLDPWSSQNLVQHDEKGLVDSTTVSTDEAFGVFLANLWPYAQGSLNYLRMPADDAAPLYVHGVIVESETFGCTRYAGGIALLHIDGNHSYGNAKSDVVLWTPKLVPGGWLVLDDYIWPYGDGPKRAGDEFLAENEGRYDCAFVMGSALFVRMKDAR